MRLAASGIALAWAALVAGVAPVAAKVAQPVDLLDRCNVVWDHLRSVKSKFQLIAGIMAVSATGRVQPGRSDEAVAEVK